MGLLGFILLFWKPDDEALRILERMNASYANCKSLRDRIDVTSVDESDSGAKSTNTYVAHVALARPASVRYEFESVKSGKPTQLSLLCVKRLRLDHSFGGLDAPVEKRMTWSADFSCQLNGKPYVERNIDLAGATYYLLPETKFTITMYVGLLLPNDIEALQFSDMTDSRVVGSERVDGFDCFVLE